MFFRLLRKLPLLLVCVASSAIAQAGPDTTVRFAGRAIDLRPYVRDNSVLEYFAPLQANGLFALVRYAGKLHMLQLPERAVGDFINPAEAQDLYPGFDLGRRHISVPLIDTVAHTLIVRADTANDEGFNLYIANKGELTRIARGRIEAPWFSFAGRVALVEQVGAKEPYSDCITLLGESTGVRKRIFCTSRTADFNAPMIWQPGGRAFVVQTAVRDRQDLTLFTLSGDTAIGRPLLRDHSLTHLTPVNWTDAQHLRFMATSDGARNVFQMDIVSGRTDTLTHFAPGRHLTLPANIQGHQVALELRTEPQGVRAYAYLLPDTAPAASVLLPEGTVVRGFTGRSWLLAHATATVPTDFRLLKVEIQGGSTAITTTPLPRDPIVPQACAVDTASYVTHDGRLVHALLRSPLRPLPNPSDRLAIVWAYYGGVNEYEELASLWCEAGIASLSPDIDRDTNGDRGGKEVADVLFAARWLRDRLGLHERQIGVYGMSQGGYNAMRALTFQPETDGINVSFNFGFGIAQAGYSSMLTILHHTNTQSPNIIATGDPETESGRARLRERSPLDQAGRLSAPLLLIHGTNDHRVQIEESRQMLAAARAAHKDVELVELPGEGHGVSIFSNLMPYYAAQISFLERVRANQQH